MFYELFTLEICLEAKVTRDTSGRGNLCSVNTYRAYTKSLEEPSNEVSIEADPVNGGASARDQSDTSTQNNHHSSPVYICQSREQQRTGSKA